MVECPFDPFEPINQQLPNLTNSNATWLFIIGTTPSEMLLGVPW